MGASKNGRARKCAIRTRVFVDENTRIARGIEQVALSNLRERVGGSHLPFSTHRHREGRHDLRPTGASEKGIAMPILVVATNELPELHATDPS